MSIGIYKFQNLITQEVYVGQSVNIEERYKRHKRDYIEGTTQFYKGIQDWGWENFSYEILELCNKEELNDREIFWINYYDSYNNGYNSTKGGSNKESINEEEIIFLYQQGLSPKEIKEKMNISLTSVYKYLTCLPEFNQKEISLFQYDLSGKFIKGWLNQEDAGNELGIDPSSIGKVLNGQRNTAGGYFWSNIKMEQFIPFKSPYQVKQICKYDLKDNLIEIFESASAAARSLGKTDGSAILKVCKNIRPTAYGYKWKYKE